MRNLAPAFVQLHDLERFRIDAPMLWNCDVDGRVEIQRILYSFPVVKMEIVPLKTPGTEQLGKQRFLIMFYKPEFETVLRRLL